MRASISENGMFRLWRRDNWKDQWCPFAPKITRCSDACPLFDERNQQPIPNSDEKARYFVVLTCGGSVHEVVQDDRKAVK